jgi:hypothetical protein
MSDLTPLNNRPGLPEIHTRVGTHGSFLGAMLDRIRTGALQGLSELHTRTSDDAMIALCDAWASIADVLTFYQERIANEGYLRTAVERRSIAELARLVGYRMRPGVAATAHLAFTLEPDHAAKLPVGLQVQTVPDDDEPARRFELVEQLDARAEWNQLKVHSQQPSDANPNLMQIFAQGITPTPRAGDAVVLVANGRPVLRRVAGAAGEFDRQRTRIELTPPPRAGGAIPPSEAVVASESRQGPQSIGVLADVIRGALDQIVTRPPRVPAMLHQDLLSLLAPDSDVTIRLRGASVRDGDADTLYAALGAARDDISDLFEVHAMRLYTAPFGATAPPPRTEGGLAATTDWPLTEDPTVLFIEAIVNDIMPGSWVGFDAPPGEPVPPPRQILSASVVSHVAYGMAARCTRLQLDGPWIDAASSAFGHLRMLTVYVGSTPVPLVREDIPGPLGQTREIELEGLVGDLEPGRWLIVEGELFDHPGVRMSEVMMLASSRHVLPTQGPGHRGVRTVLVLVNELSYSYRRGSVGIWGNVARATEGETFIEVLGSGDGSRAGQAFAPARMPLTYISAPNVNGAESSVRVTVNGVTWEETDNLVRTGPNDRKFVIEPAGLAPLLIRFGNGVNGARLPTGVENVLAHYRVGLGADGNCDAGQISQLLTRPAGVRSVINPRPASGGADSESRDAARRNAAAGLTALGRLVGVQDYADFAHSFAGVGKADAILVHRNGAPTLLVTIAAQDETPIQADADLLLSLADALQRWGDPSQAVIVLPARNLRVLLSARVGLVAGYHWEWVQPRLRDMLLDRFGYPVRQLGQNLWESELLAAMHAVEGVATVALDALSRLGDPVTTAALAAARSLSVADIQVRTARLAQTETGREPRGAEVAFLWRSMPELIALTEIPF